MYLLKRPDNTFDTNINMTVCKQDYNNEWHRYQKILEDKYKYNVHSMLTESSLQVISALCESFGSH